MEVTLFNRGDLGEDGGEGGGLGDISSGGDPITLPKPTSLSESSVLFSGTVSRLTLFERGDWRPGEFPGGGVGIVDEACSPWVTFGNLNGVGLQASVVGFDIGDSNGFRLGSVVVAGFGGDCDRGCG